MKLLSRIYSFFINTTYQNVICTVALIIVGMLTTRTVIPNLQKQYANRYSTTYSMCNRYIKPSSGIIREVMIYTPPIVFLLMKNAPLYREYTVAISAAVAIGDTLKRVVKKPRPDNTNNRAFPSGHALLSFFAAIFIYRKYGKTCGIPLIIVAAAVSVSRVYCNRHDTYDIVGGAMIGSFCAIYTLSILQYISKFIEKKLNLNNDK